jgi:hypothetical protein
MAALQSWLEHLGGEFPTRSYSYKDVPLIEGMRQDAKRLLKQLTRFQALPHFDTVYAPGLWAAGPKRGKALLEVVNHEEAKELLLSIRRAIFLLLSWLESITGEGKSHPRGKEIAGHPGLVALVFGLEHAAQLGGGHFIASRRRGEKGTMLGSSVLANTPVRARVMGSYSGGIPPIAGAEQLLSARGLQQSSGPSTARRETCNGVSRVARPPSGMDDLAACGRRTLASTFGGATPSA